MKRTDKTHTLVRPTSRRLSDKPENVRRRMKYVADAVYRQQAKTRALTHAHAQRQNIVTAALRSAALHPYNKKLIEFVRSGQFTRYASVRYLRDSRKPVTCFTAGEMSGVLGRSKDAILVWQERGLIPQGDVFVCGHYGRPFYGFSVPLARRVLLAILHTVHGPRGHVRAFQESALKQRLLSDN